MLKQPGPKNRKKMGTVSCGPVILSRTDDVLSTLAKYSVGNLVRQAFDQSDVVRPGASAQLGLSAV